MSALVSNNFRETTFQFDSKISNWFDSNVTGVSWQCEKLIPNVMTFLQAGAFCYDLNATLVRSERSVS